MRRRIVELTILVFIAVIIAFISELRYRNQHVEDKSDLIELPAYEPEMEYGIVVDSLYIFKGKIKRNQFLADILLKHGVSYADIDLAAKRSKKVFDVRRIRRGNNYSVLCKNDSTRKVQYFIYEESPVSFVVFDFRDSIHIHRGKKAVEVKFSKISGVIKSSLWESMVDANADPNLANDLSEIYAWTIDFFGLQKGDHFKVYFEERYVEGQRIGLGKILASNFNHYNKDHFAYYFVQDSMGDYFDEEGKSLRRAFLKAPLTYKRVSSKFSYSRMHPVLKYRRPHLGVDYAAAVGTPVLSVGDGVVQRIYRTKQGGKSIKIKHNGTYTTAYLHLSGYGKGIRTGKKVKQGDIIGYVGKTGLVTGPHLDFRFYKNGKAVDPLKVKSPSVKPVKEMYRAEYDSVIKIYNSILGSFLN